MIVNYIFGYLTLGVVFTFLMDILSNKFDVKTKLDSTTRIFCVLLWPFALHIFLSSYFNNKNRNE